MTGLRRISWPQLAYDRYTLSHRDPLDHAMHAALCGLPVACTDRSIAECEAPEVARCPKLAVLTRSRPAWRKPDRYICTALERQCSHRREDAWLGPALLFDPEYGVSRPIRTWIAVALIDAAGRSDFVGTATRAMRSGDWTDIDGACGRKPKPDAIAAERERATVVVIDHLARRIQREKPWKRRSQRRGGGA